MKKDLLNELKDAKSSEVMTAATGHVIETFGAWQESDDYKNARRWCADEGAVDGSLWHAYLTGFQVAQKIFEKLEGDNKKEWGIAEVNLVAAISALRGYTYFGGPGDVEYFKRLREHYIAQIENAAKAFLPAEIEFSDGDGK